MTSSSASGTVEQLRYGTNEHGRPQNTGERCWVRIDTYTRATDGEVFSERRFCLDAADDSPVAHDRYADNPGNIRYNSKCACCYLGFSHTVAYHIHFTTKEARYDIKG